MSLGLCGTHRTGKSTLAKAYALAEGVPYLQTGATQVFLDMGLDPKVDYPLDVRIQIQKRILESFDKQYSAAGRDFITDRTPIDMMAYTLADVQRGIPVYEEGGKAPANAAYMEHISALVMGLVVSEIIAPNHYYIPRQMTNLAERVKVLRKVNGKTLEKHQAFLQQRIEQGNPVVFH